jgi:hypothetical protein
MIYCTGNYATTAPWINYAVPVISGTTKALTCLLFGMISHRVKCSSFVWSKIGQIGCCVSAVLMAVLAAYSTDGLIYGKLAALGLFSIFETLGIVSVFLQ